MSTQQKIGLEEKLSNIEQEKEKIQSDFNMLEKKESDIKTFLTDKITELKQKIEHWPPWQKKSKIDKTSRIKNLADLFSVLNDELSITENTEYSKDIVDGTDADILKSGGIFFVYKSSGGNIGFLERKILKNEISYYWKKDINYSLKGKLENIFKRIEKGEKKLLIPIDVTLGTKLKEAGKIGGLRNWFVKGGPVMLPISIVALLIIVMSAERLLTFRREYTNADVLMERIMALWDRGHREDAIKLCETVSGPVARMLHVGLEHHQKGIKVVEEMLHEQHLEELPKLEKNLSTIAICTSIAPLLANTVCL
ncbi:MAG: hypothetical protein AB1349_07185 [Elusimicrobiota bacterium]